MINNKKQNQAGFTLVELSIVLVIIGLIVSGVLAGQALIQQAKVRGQLRQIEELKTALGAFQAKYNFLPGDLPNPVRFFGAITTTNPNGNGLIEGNVDATDTESSLAFFELNLAGLLQDKAPDAGSIITSRLRRTTGMALNSTQQRSFNYLFFGLVPDYVPATDSYRVLASTLATNNGFSGLEAYSLDSKIDDANGSTGSLFLLATATNISTTTAVTPVTAAINNCTAANGQYYINESSTTANQLANVAACTFALRAGF